ncbi:DNA-3-methyladenine glycosylase [Alloactinosynnema sp. L-07]|uniref:DNA-3-methyladenine glycosylase family protein n=1 Tax=Alloactinosynnema sp. L-07 TaxID=1653480 RepID=UPI0006B4649A|nr:3-methyladenine DNA glycosylase [Alloactinosynnema sp. L-07]
MTAIPAPAALVRHWAPDGPHDVASALRPLRRGPGDPAWQQDERGLWLAANTPDGAGTLCLRIGDDVAASAWGPGAERLIDGLPALLGAEDDDSGFVAHHPLVAESRRRRPGLRLGSTGRVWDVLLAAIIEQKVTGTEAYRTWRDLARRFGDPAPGPAPAGLTTPPSPRAVLGIEDWEWHKAGLDGARRRAVLAAAQVAGRLERAVELKGEEGRALLRKVPGIGVWTAAEVAQRAWGDPDALSVGDYHLSDLIGYGLLGHKIDDDRMLEELAPYTPQRHRAALYVLLGGPGKPRFAPRFSPRDYRRL